VFALTLIRISSFFGRQRVEDLKKEQMKVAFEPVDTHSNLHRIG